MPINWNDYVTKKPEEISGVDWTSYINPSTAAGTGGLTSQRTSAAIEGYVGGLQGVGEEVTKAVGLDTASEYLKDRRERNEYLQQIHSQRARELGGIESYKDVTDVSSALNYAAGLGIQSAPYMLEAIAGGAEARLLMKGTRAAIEEATTAYRAAQASGDVAAAAKAKQALEAAQKTLSTGQNVGIAA